MADRFIIDTSGGGTGGGIGDIDFSLTASIQSASGWIVYDTYIGNSGSLDVAVTSSLTVNQPYAGEDIFVVKQAQNTKFLINDEGIPILTNRGSLPTLREGGITYTNNEFYFGYS